MMEQETPTLVSADIPYHGVLYMKMDHLQGSSRTEVQEISPQSQLSKKKVKLKKADHELRKCIGNGKCRETVLKSKSLIDLYLPP